MEENAPIVRGVGFFHQPISQKAWRAEASFVRMDLSDSIEFMMGESLHMLFPHQKIICFQNRLIPSNGVAFPRKEKAWDLPCHVPQLEAFALPKQLERNNVQKAHAWYGEPMREQLHQSASSCWQKGTAITAGQRSYLP